MKTSDDGLSLQQLILELLPAPELNAEAQRSGLNELLAKVHILDARGSSKHSIAAQVQARMLAKGPALGLRELLLSRANLPAGAHIHALAEALRQGFCPVSKVVNLSYNKIGTVAAEAMMDVLQAVGGTCNEDDGVQALAGALKKLSLRGPNVLALGVNVIGHGEPEALAGAFKVGTSPVNLNPGSNSNEENGVIALAKIIAKSSLAVLQIIDLGSNAIGVDSNMAFTTHSFPPMAHKAHRVTGSTAHCATASIRSYIDLAQALNGALEDDHRETAKRSLHVSRLKGFFGTTQEYPGIANAEKAKLVSNALFRRSGHAGDLLLSGDGHPDPMPAAATTSLRVLRLQEQPKSVQEAEPARSKAARAHQRRPNQHQDQSSLKQIILYETSPTTKRESRNLSLQSRLEAGMQFVAHYSSDDDPASICESTRLELTACFPDSTFYELDYATSASTVIYITVLKVVDESNINQLADALSKRQTIDDCRPTITLKWAPESDCRDVFELKKSAGVWALLPILGCPTIDRIVQVSFERAGVEGSIDYLVMHGFNLLVRSGLAMRWHTGRGGVLGSLVQIHPDTLAQQGVHHLVEEKESLAFDFPWAALEWGGEGFLYLECWRGFKAIGNQIRLALSSFRLIERDPSASSLQNQPPSQGPRVVLEPVRRVESTPNRSTTSTRTPTSTLTPPSEIEEESGGATTSATSLTAALRSALQRALRTKAPTRQSAGQEAPTAGATAYEGHGREEAAGSGRGEEPGALRPLYGARWRYEVFISHAGTVKDFARDVANELKRLGFRTFVDADELKPGDEADAKMVKAAETSPIGLVLFDSNFFSRDWPMRELGIIVKTDTLLPVLVGLSYSEAEAALRRSALAKAPFGESFVRKVLRTTFGQSEGLRYGELRQRVCLDVTRVFVVRVCPGLPNVLSSAGHFHQALEAAKMLRGKGSFGQLTKDDCDEIDRWIEDLKAKLGIS